jgi:hypothetical protein
MIKIYMDSHDTPAFGRYNADRRHDATVEGWADLDPAVMADEYAEGDLYGLPETVHVLAIGPNGERREWVCRRRVAYDAEAV